MPKKRKALDQRAARERAPAAERSPRAPNGKLAQAKRISTSSKLLLAAVCLQHARRGGQLALGLLPSSNSEKPILEETSEAYSANPSRHPCGEHGPSSRHLTPQDTHSSLGRLAAKHRSTWHTSAQFVLGL